MEPGSVIKKRGGTVPCLFTSLSPGLYCVIMLEKGGKSPGQGPSYSGPGVTKPSSAISEGSGFSWLPLHQLSPLPLVMAAAAAANVATVEMKLL